MRKLLVALDHSANAPKVLSEAARIARAEKAELILLHVVTLPVGLPEELYRIPPDQVAEVELNRARKALAEQAEKMEGGLSRSIEVKLGGTWQTICEMAIAKDVDLIVIGSHGYHGMDRL